MKTWVEDIVFCMQAWASRASGAGLCIPVAILCVVITAAAPAHAQFSLETWFPFAGGGFSAGGEFTLQGGIGALEPLRSADGQFTLEPMAWSLHETSSPGAERPKLRVERQGQFVVVSWPVNAVGWRLEVANQPAPSTQWRIVNASYTTNEQDVVYTISASAQASFYRLRQELVP